MKATLLVASGLVLAVALSFLLSGMEAGLPLLSRVRVRQLCRQKRTSARILQELLDRPDEFLWTILVGNTLATFGLLCASLYVMQYRLGSPRWLVFALLVVVAFLLYALADLLPKMLFRTYPTRLCLAVARPFRLIHLALRPLVATVAWFANLVLRLTGGRRFQDRLFGSREELRSLMQESAKGLTLEEVTMVNRVLDLQNRTVGSLMLPMNQVGTVPPHLAVSEFLRLCRESGRERMPVREVGAAETVGVMSLRSALYQEGLDAARPIRDFMTPPFHLDPSLRLEEALKRFQRSGHRLAIVRDRHRRECGLLTLGDLLRFLFGEVHL